ncbi:protein translocase subunit secG [Poseidonocella pacifica]|uniref:Protein-export membrane protein SecG n=1 Tax=Poseidonocella pacifica TaxID=871651 RepID=A0A1I0X1K8_9RHOB|nr:preprotein translocase subunit SecG [Poseidonocella pacifica]SFA94875.1 protein translocase subunit secG [Poseidonocella pacifica]
MENVVLIIHLLLALSLIGVVLLQRNEGGLGSMGGGGGGAISGRAAATAMGKLTWILAAAFIVTSLTLTVIAASNSTGSSIIDRLGVPASEGDATIPTLPGVDGGSLLPPSNDDAPLIPGAD